MKAPLIALRLTDPDPDVFYTVWAVHKKVGGAVVVQDGTVKYDGPVYYVDPIDPKPQAKPGDVVIDHHGKRGTCAATIAKEMGFIPNYHPSMAEFMLKIDTGQMMTDGAQKAVLDLSEKGQFHLGFLMTLLGEHPPARGADAVLTEYNHVKELLDAAGNNEVIAESRVPAFFSL